MDIVDGENPRPWVSAYQTGAVSSTLAQQVHAALVLYQARHDAHLQQLGRSTG